MIENGHNAKPHRLLDALRVREHTWGGEEDLLDVMLVFINPSKSDPDSS